MNCRHAEARLHAAADHALALEAQLELDAHVAECARCAELARALAALEAVLVRSAEPPLEALDVERHVRAVRAAIDARTEPRREPRFGLPWLVSAAAAAAALIALLWLTRTAPRDVERVVERAPHPAERELPGGDLPCDVVDELGTTTTPHADVAHSHEAPTVVSPPSEHEAHAPDLAETEPVIDAAPPELTELERERWEAARRSLAGALVAALDASRDAGREALAADFASRTRELRRATWPVARLAEGLANESTHDVARAALRYLGLHGDRANVRALQRGLTTPELAVDAALALADLGAAGGDTAADTLLTLAPALRDAALARIAETRDARAAESLETLARRALRTRVDTREAEARDEFARRALDTLPNTGPPAVACLLHLAADGLVLEDSALARLQVTPGATEELARLLERAPRVYPAALLIRAVERLRPANGPAWLASRAEGDRDLRATAVTALAQWDDEHAARALVALHTTGRLERATLSAALAGLVERAPAAAAELVRVCTRERERVALQLVFTEITSLTRSESTPALLALAESEVLTRSDRKSALLEAGELATAEHAAEFATLFRTLDVRERELRSGCVLPIHALGGAAAIRELFPRANVRALERVLALLADPRANTRPTTTLIRVAKELDALEPRAAP